MIPWAFLSSTIQLSSAHHSLMRMELFILLQKTGVCMPLLQMGVSNGRTVDSVPGEQQACSYGKEVRSSMQLIFQSAMAPAHHMSKDAIHQVQESRGILSHCRLQTVKNYGELRFLDYIPLCAM